MNANELDLLDRFIGKITSARFVITVMVIATLCLSVDKCLDIAVQCAYNEKVFILVKDIIMILIGAFVSVATAIATLYYTRTDRKSFSRDSNGNSDNP